MHYISDDWTIISSGVSNFETQDRSRGGVVLVDKNGNHNENLSRNILLLIGNEGRGVPHELHEFSDLLVGVRPHNLSHNRVDSLNVSVAAGILIQFFKEFKNKL